MKIKFSHELTIGTSRVFEVLSVIHALIEGSRHELVFDLSPFHEIAVRHTELLNGFRAIGHLDFVWFEFALLIAERQSIEVYFREIRELDRTKQLIYFLAHNCDEEQLEQAMSSTSELTALLATMEYDNPGLLASMLMDFDATARNWELLANEIDCCPAFSLALNDPIIQADLEKQVDAFHQGMIDRHPLSYAQSLMGKPFWNIADYKSYEFYAVYYESPWRFRLMDDKKQIMVHSIYRTPDNPEKICQELADVMKLLGDPTRLKILQMLFMRPQYGKEIADALGLSTPTVSHHLEVLHAKGLVNLEQNKQIKYFSTNLQTIRRWLNAMDRFIQQTK